MSAAETYKARVAQYERIAAAEARQSKTHSRLRLLTAAVIVAGLVWVTGAPGPWPAVAIGAAVAIFAGLVVRHDRIERRHDAALTMATLNREARARLERRWDGLPRPWHVPMADTHAFANDLDVAGHASLLQILGPVRTPTGRQMVVEWLTASTPPAAGEIAARQAAVGELAADLHGRQQLAALARQLPDDALGIGMVPHAVQWAEGPSSLAAWRWVPPVAVALTVLTVAGAIGSALGATAGIWWLGTGLAGWVLRKIVHAPLEHDVHGATGEYGLRAWAPLIAQVERARRDSRLLRDVQAALGTTGTVPASRALADLEQLVVLSDVRHSVWLYVPLQSLLLWDLHVWWAMDRWRRRHGSRVRGWLDAVGRADALGGLASLAFDHPDWAWPQIDDAADRLEGRALGHPLLADAVRVTNDVAVGPPGRFLLITGSNMSGKSTLLRAIGLNVLLAQAGAPVCASALRLPRLALHTSMRVSDSLELGLSLFMASLVRLAQVVEAARRASPDLRVCYLLDEVLQGTNSAERQVAVRSVMGHLLGCDAIGVVTTHDLELAADPAFTSHADSVHLEETLAGTGEAVTMTFDYRLKPGPARAGNALQLLRMLGLGER